MISDLDETIKQLLVKKGGLKPSEVDIVFDMPDREWSGKVTKPTVNVYLYDIHENRDFRTNEWSVVHQNGVATKTKWPIRVDLSYLVTVWTSDTADQHRLLAHVLATLCRYPELPEDLLQGDLAKVEWPLMAQAAQPDGVLRNTADFWSALDNQLKPSVNYVVTIPIDLDVALTVPEVRTKKFSLKDSTGATGAEITQVGGIVRRRGKPDRVVPDATLLIKELEMTASTDGQGRYSFRNVDPGSYKLEVSVPGEKAKQAALKVPSPSYDIEV